MCKKRVLILGLLLILSISIVACQNSESSFLSEAEAKKIALEKFDLEEDQVTFTKFKKEIDDIDIFEIEFRTDDEEFEIKLNAKSGEVLSYEREYYKEESSQTDDQPISEEEAKKIALDHFGLNAAEVNFTKFEKDYDDGFEVYEMKFNSQGKKFKVKVNVADGSVLKFEEKAISSSKPASNETGSKKSNQGIISESEAKKIVLNKVKGANESHFTKFKTDTENGRLQYEGEILYNGVEYEFEIDAQTGKIVDWEIDD